MNREKIQAGRGGSMNYGNGSHYGKAGIVFFFLLLLAFSVFANGAEASRGYLSSFSTAYPSSPLTRDCLICHTNSTASPSTRNPYGSAYGSAGHNFAAIESSDSDGDGASNIAEINAGTYPGNASSVPAAALSITTASPLPAGTVGTAYSQSFASSGGTGTKSWSVSAGTLPAGLSLSSAGVLSGTPTTAATSSFTVQVTGGGTATKAFSLTVNAAAAALSITTASPLPAGTVGTAYSQSFASSGGTGTKSWSVSAGTLPAGLSLSSAGVLSGTPTTAATSSFTVQVTGGGTATKAFSLTVNAAAAALSITTASPLPAGTVGTAYSQSFASSGGTGTKSWSVSAGTLPAGLSLSSAGVLSGTPTTAATSSFTVQVTGGGTATKAFSLTVNAAAAALSITTASPLPAGTVGTAYSQSFASSGGTGTKSWSVSAGTLPAGLSLSSAGVLSGTPTTAATSSFTVQVTGGGTATKAFSLTVNDVTPPAGTLDVMPQDTATDVPVNTVITATESGLTDISTIFNEDTFTLRPDVSTPDSAMEPSWPYRSAVCTSAGVVQGTFTYNAARTEATFTPNCPLENGTTYLASIAAGAGSTLTAPENWIFTTIASSPDSDEDGSPDNEDDSPHDGQRTSRWCAKGTGKIHVDSSRTAGTFIRGAVGISDTSSSLNQAGKPAGYAFHDGMIAFREVGVVSGSSAQVTVTFPSPILQGSKVYRAGADGFHEVPSAVIDGNTVTLTVTGGSPSIHAAASPSDNVAQDNGVLVDPVGVAAPVSSGSGSIDMSSSASGGGCSVVGGSGPAGSNLDAFLILASLGVTVRMFRIRRMRG